jgi:hypothetical protein
MAASHDAKAASALAEGDILEDERGGSINPEIAGDQADRQPQSAWRQEFDAHPAAEAFPPLTDEELDALGKDIKANGLRQKIAFLYQREGGRHLLLDGRNRLEAMERAGIDAGPQHWEFVRLKSEAEIWAYVSWAEPPPPSP